MMLKINNLSKDFPDGTNALKNISFEVNRGEFVVILGPSGSGKTSLLQCINSLLDITEGNIILNDNEISFKKPSNSRQNISMIFQDFSLVQNLSVINNVLSGMLDKSHPLLSLLYLFDKKQKIRALECIDQVGLLSKAYDKTSFLSGGQQQRVGIARALARKPQIILADEPVASLDPMIAFQVLSILKEISASQGITVICNLHQVDLALRFSDRIIGLTNGKIILDVPNKNIDHKYIQNIYGSDNEGLFFGAEQDYNFTSNNIPLTS
jgi:phosphonate transport system ATP-binding protein